MEGWRQEARREGVCELRLPPRGGRSAEAAGREHAGIQLKPPQRQASPGQTTINNECGHVTPAAPVIIRMLPHKLRSHPAAGTTPAWVHHRPSAACAPLGHWRGRVGGGCAT
eukprot:198633-Chlamydomonas_euryale.AAC.3